MRGFECSARRNENLGDDVNTQAGDASKAKSDIESIEDCAEDFKPMSAAEAARWRARHPSVSVWRLVGAQLLAGALLVALVALFWRSKAVVFSVAYGVLAVVLPAAVFARGVMRKRGKIASLGMFAVWELAKLLLTVALLAAAPRWVSDLQWLALIAAMIVMMNVYWAALLVWPRGV